MRIRIGIFIGSVFATLFSPIVPSAIGAGGFASAPQNVTSTAIAGGLRVTWQLPADVDLGISGYKIESSTTGTTGTWGTAVTVSSSTFSYDIVGLSQVARYVRVAATTNSGNNTGTYGYPWTEVYRTISPKNNSGDTSINYVSGFGIGAGEAAASLNNATNFTRVRYRMEATLNGVADYAETDFYKWSGASITTLQVPVIGGGSSTFEVQTNVTDLNTYSTNSRVTNAAGISGRLEIWPWNYDPARASDYATGSNLKYDYNDSSIGSGSYGSFQVHDLNNLKTVFAWNFRSYNSNLTDPDLGFGDNPTAGANAMADWTFCHENSVARGYCPSPSAFKLQVFINRSVTPLADTTPPTVSRGDARNVIKSGETISVRSTEIGTAYLVRNTVSVTNVASITAATASDRNSLSISAANTSTTLTTSGLQDGIYNLYAADSFGNLSIGLLETVRVDTTPPVATAFSVSSAGNTILMTIGETATQSSFNASAFSVSDSGSAISVTSATISGLVITLNLSRIIPAGASVTFAYTLAGVPNAERWSDAAGNQLAAVTSRVITNNSASQISVNLVVANPLSKGTSTTISVSVSVVGRVTFTIAGKRIPGCFNKIAIGSTPVTVTCTFKPAVTARQRISATFTPTLGAYPVTVASVERFILKRSNLR